MVLKLKKLDFSRAYILHVALDEFEILRCRDRDIKMFVLRERCDVR